MDQKNPNSNSQTTDIQYGLNIQLTDHFHTSPPLSLTPIMFGCVDSLITTSAGRSMPVLAGTLYKITGIGETSATFRHKQVIPLSWCDI